MNMRIFALIFVLLFASAANAEFLVFGEQSLSFQPCSTDSRNLTVQNIGNSASYSLSVEGEGAQFVTFSTLSFNLESAQSAVIPVFYTIPCTTELDAYSLSIFFSDGQEEQELQQEIIVTVNTLNATTIALSHVSTPCQLTTYNFTLHNPSNLTEIYRIEAEGRNDLALSEEETVLTSQASKTITLSIEPQDCTESGNFPLEVTFTAEKSKESAKFNVEYIITPTDILVLAEDVNTIKTDYADSTTQLTIQNIGDRRTQYSLSVEGVSWARITPEQITLSPGEKKEATLRLIPPQDEPAGTYKISFLATVAGTGIVYSKDINLILSQPTSLEQNPVKFAIFTMVVFAILILFVILVKYFKSESFAKWREKRRQAKERKQALKEKRKREREEKRKKEAERQQKLKDKIKTRVERELRKEFRLVAHKDLIKASKYKKPFNKGLAFLIFAVIVAAVALATWNFLVPNLQYVVGALIVIMVLLFLFLLKRQTSFTKYFKVLMPEYPVPLRVWKKGLSYLEILPKQPTRKFKVHVQKRKTKVQPSPSVYQTFSLHENAAAKTLATFAIPKRFIRLNESSIENVRLARFSNQEWKTIRLEKTGENKKSVFFRAELEPGTYSLYLKGTKPKKSKAFSWVLGVIGLALLVLAINNLYTPVIEGVIPPQTWKKDTIHQIELSQYFKDPDNDPLTFSATSLQNIDVDIIGNRATLTQEPGWTGSEIIRFSADDGKGGIITSNAVQLNVREYVISKPLKVSSFLIAGLIGFLLIVLAFTRLRTGKQSRK